MGQMPFPFALRCYKTNPKVSEIVCYNWHNFMLQAAQAEMEMQTVDEAWLNWYFIPNLFKRVNMRAGIAVT